MKAIKLKFRVAFVPLFCMLFVLPPLYAADRYERERQALVELLKEDARSGSYIGNSEFDSQVMAAISRVPRHLFVPRKHRKRAYENVPLSIGHGQTISQPYIVLLMTDLLELKRDDKVLEVGTGSGYQAAILAELTDKVYSIEIIEPLFERATKLLKRQNYTNIQTRVGDGYYGWRGAEPFDAIVVTAAASHIPPPLVRQLKPGGRMVIPVGSRFMVQQLVLLQKDGEGQVSLQQILPVRFVPLTGGHDDK